MHRPNLCKLKPTTHPHQSLHCYPPIRVLYVPETTLRLYSQTSTANNHAMFTAGRTRAECLWVSSLSQCNPLLLCFPGNQFDSSVGDEKENRLIHMLVWVDKSGKKHIPDNSSENTPVKGRLVEVHRLPLKQISR